MQKIYFLPFVFVGAPYFGASVARIGVYSLFGLFLVSSAIMCVLIPYRKVDRVSLLFALPIFTFCIGLINQTIFIGNLSATDIADLLKPISYIIYFSYGYVLAAQIEFQAIIKFIFWYLVALVILNFIVAVGPFISSPVSLFSEIFGLGPEYHEGYARFRAFGIVGQPGILGIYCNIIHIILFFIISLQGKTKKDKIVLFILALLNAITLLSSFSRISVGFFLLINISLYISNREIRSYINYIFILALFVCIYFISDILDMMPFLWRGVDLSLGNFGTLGMRLQYKVLILELLSENFATSVFGIGPSKEFLQPPLRHPDSSFSLFLLRFGILGQILYIIPIVFSIMILRKSLCQHRRGFGNLVHYKYIKTILIINIYLFLVAQLEPAYSDIKINFLNFTLLGIAVAISKHSSRYIRNSTQLTETSK